MKEVKIQTNRLLLESPLGIVKPEEVFLAIHEKETVEYIEYAPCDYTIRNAEQFLRFLEMEEKMSGHLNLGIFFRESGDFIGMVSLEHIHDPSMRCELKVWIDNDYTGLGLACEAVRQVIDYAVKTMHINEIEAYVIKEDTRAIRLFERLGFKQKSLLLADCDNKGHLVDRFFYLDQLSV